MMSEKIRSAFQFEHYTVDEATFRANPFYEDQGKLDVEFSFDVAFGVDASATRGKVSLTAEIFDNPEANNFPFTLRITVSGFFKAEDDLSEEDFREFLEINGTTVLFPFLRAAIADITRVANIKPLVLPLINVPALIKRQKDQEVRDD